MGLEVRYNGEISLFVKVRTHKLTGASGAGVASAFPRGVQHGAKLAVLLLWSFGQMAPAGLGRARDRRGRTVCHNKPCE